MRKLQKIKIESTQRELLTWMEWLSETLTAADSGQRIDGWDLLAMVHLKKVHEKVRHAFENQKVKVTLEPVEALAHFCFYQFNHLGRLTMKEIIRNEINQKIQQTYNIQ